MKLYTEEQVKKMIYDGNNMWYGYDAIISRYTPIELPSDEEIKHCIGSVNYTEYDNGFIQGIKWMKEQILNQNKQNTNTNFTPHNANAVAEYNEGLNNFTPHNANAVAEYNERLKNFTSNK